MTATVRCFVAVCLCVSLPAVAIGPPPEAAEDVLPPDGVVPLPPRATRGWTGGAAIVFGSGAPHGESGVGYLELGRRLNGELAIMGVADIETGLSPHLPNDLISAGMALRFSGDRLAPFSAPIELTIGGGATYAVHGTTALGIVGPLGMVFIDTVFPVTAYFRIHSFLCEHVAETGVFLTGGGGLGITFE